MALLDNAAITELLTEVARRIDGAGQSASILLVGGAAIAVEYGDRPATRDVDAGFAPADVVVAAAADVARARGLPADWLNDKVNMWMPHHGVQETEWRIVHRQGEVFIRVAPAEVLLAMKLLAGRGRRDAHDIKLLLGVCEVRSIAEAHAIFDRYYPDDEVAPRAMAILREQFDE
jgi:hypothetical protein